MKKKGWLAIVLNLLIVVLEIVGFILTWRANGRIPIEYYTEDSNLLILAVSALYLVFAALKKPMPKWLAAFKHMATVGLAITFLVVIFILAPMYQFNYGYLLFHEAMLYQHTLCPLLGIATFLWCDQLGELPKLSGLRGVSFTIVYAIIMTVLNIIGKVTGPYPFLMVRHQSVLLSIVWAVVIIGLAHIISVSLAVGYRKIRKESHRVHGRKVRR